MKPRHTNEQLVARFQAGDASALADLIASNEGVIYRAATKYSRGLDPDDAMQVGRMAMMHAAELFDGGRGIKFTTYAWWAVARTVMRWSILEHREPSGRGTNVKDDDGPTLDMLHSSIARPEEIAIAREHHEAVRTEARMRLAMLDPRSRKVVLDRVSGRTLKETGDEIGLSKERVRQLYERSLRRMKDAMSARNG